MKKNLKNILLATTLLGASSPAFALDNLDKAPGGLSAEIRGTQTFSYDTNPLRVVNGAEDIYGSTTSPELIVRYKTPLSEIISDSRVDASFYDDSDFDSVDFHQKLTLSRTNQRWTAALNAVADYDTARTSEVTNYGINIPKVRSTRFGLMPQIDYRMTPADRFILRGSYSATSYDNSAFTDYDIYSITPAYEHQFDRFNSGSITVAAQRYETTNGVSQTSDSIGPMIGWTNLLTQQLTLRLNAGAQYIEKSGANQVGSTGWNYVFRSDLGYKDASNEALLSATRALAPFGNGTETLLTTFGLEERHIINENLAVKANGLYQFADYDSPPGVNLDQGYTLGAGLTYRLFTNVDLETTYKFRSEDLTNISGSVDQHVVMVGLTLHPEWSTR